METMEIVYGGHCRVDKLATTGLIDSAREISLEWQALV
jgi:hypothetical protein